MLRFISYGLKTRKEGERKAEAYKMCIMLF